MSNTPAPIVRTLFGTSTAVTPVQFWNAYCPMVVTVDGIISDVTAEQPEKA